MFAMIHVSPLLFQAVLFSIFKIFLNSIWFNIFKSLPLISVFSPFTFMVIIVTVGLKFTFLLFASVNLWFSVSHYHTSFKWIKYLLPSYFILLIDFLDLFMCYMLFVVLDSRASIFKSSGYSRNNLHPEKCKNFTSVWFHLLPFYFLCSCSHIFYSYNAIIP